MRRQLVITNEAARHPIRVRLVPPATSVPRGRGRRIDDIREFVLGFTACFLAALAFIS